MTDKKLLELAKQVEVLDGPCREVDALVEVQRRRFAAYACGLNDNTRAHWEADEKGNVSSQGTTYAAAPFTASLDAAMALVPEGWIITDVTQRLPSNQNWQYSVELGQLIDGDWNFVRAFARKCPPNGFAVALTAAALRAGETK